MKFLHYFFIILLFQFHIAFAQNQLDLLDEILTSDELIDYHVTLSGNSELHLTGDITSVSGTTFDFLSEDSWIFFHEILPSDVNNILASQIFINGEPVLSLESVRFELYRHGTVVIPHPSDYLPLRVFKEQNLLGDSMDMGLYTYYREEQLDGFNDNISSFRLKRGYMATFAQNEFGKGFSRVFIAQDEDLMVEVMPEGLDNSASFVRVFPWKQPSKKGWGGGGLTPPWQQMQFTWYYNWNANSQSELNYEYIPIRHNYYWPGWSLINNIENTTQLLGYNEPERDDQADMTVEQALEQWPRLMESGLRLGSPSPSDGGRPWLYEFMDRADELNYRVDFVSMHWYEGCRTPLQFYNRLRQVHERTGRPIWVKEFNNGANWTSGCHPTWEENAAWFAEVLPMLDTASFVERYAVFHYMQEPFRMIHDGQITPAGQVYSEHQAFLAYNPDKEYIMDYIPVPRPVKLQANMVDAGTRLRWIGHVPGNKGLQVERSTEDGDFELIADIPDFNEDSFLDEGDLTGETSYRIRFFVNDTYSMWSDTANVFVASQEVPYSIEHNSSGLTLSFSATAGNAVLESESDQGYYQKWRILHAGAGQYYIENVAGNKRLYHSTEEGLLMVHRSNTSQNARWQVETHVVGSPWRFLINRATGRKLHAGPAGTSVGTTEPQWTGANVQWRLTPLDPLPTGIIVDAVSDNKEQGTVTGGGYYEHGEEVVLLAVAKPGFRFVRWEEEGQTVYSDALYMFTAADQDRILTAFFEPDAYTVTFSVQNQNQEDLLNAIILFGDIQNDAGDYTFEDILPGEYDFSVVNPGYLLYTGTAHVETEDKWIQVTMQSIDTQVEDQTSDHLMVFPNPARDKLYVQAPLLNMEEAVIQLLNSYGRVVLIQNFKQVKHDVKEIDISGLPEGIYLLVIDNDTVRYTAKFIISK